jgi:hypothetical protein
MQTFLPFDNFQLSATVLDKKRCWKQVVEAKQLICALRAKNIPVEWSDSKSYKNKTYSNHPAYKMWVGYEEALKKYYNVFLARCLSFHFIKTDLPFLHVDESFELPWWIGSVRFHRSMRARLIEKDREYYLKRFPNDDGYNAGKYYWPDMETKTFKIIN